MARPPTFTAESIPRLLAVDPVPHALSPPSSHSSGSTSPTLEEPPSESAPPAAPKKKKKRKTKKPAKPSTQPPSPTKPEDDPLRAPVLCISRNKHWRYISSYHGPWLQLPIELLDSLLVLNLDPATLQTPDIRMPPLPAPSVTPIPSSFHRIRDRGFNSPPDNTFFDTSHSPFASISSSPLPAPPPGKAMPPPIDPGAFRSVTTIRRLIDEAAELSVRASSGLSAVALGSMRSGGPSSMNGSPWAIAQSLGINPLGDGGGRNVTMSAMRIHRLRALAVQKLAAAYRTDEIASSVMVMQGGSVFDDIAERVLKVDPNDADAKYVHFFHEKIPSRQLAESTTTQVLDELIAVHPHRLELYRTRGIVSTFRDEYILATRDFTHALKEARAVRKARTLHRHNIISPQGNGKNAKKKKGDTRKKTNGQAPPNGTSASADGHPTSTEDEPLLLHPSVLPDAPDPLEHQLLFLRGAAYLQHAVFLIEQAILKLEGIRKVPSTDGTELRLCYIENGRYGGVEIGNPDGPLGQRDGAKAQAYRQVLAADGFRAQIYSLLKKSIRDHERFLAHFDTLETAPAELPSEDLAARTAYAFLLTEALRPGSHSAPPPLPDTPPMFTTYHPLLVEAHFSVLLCLLMLGDFAPLLATFVRTASLVDGLEGYPVFLPPRSMAQAEFVEVLERLAGGWHAGVQPHSLARAQTNGKLAIEAPPLPPPPPPPPAASAPPSPRPPPAADQLSPSSSSSCASSSSRQQQQQPSEPPSGRETPVPAPVPASGAPGVDLAGVLDCARILLAPVAKRQRERAERAAAEKASGKRKPAPINIPLHGPRVEIVLAWVAAVWLVELEGAA